ncbi:MAG: Rieske (2Fe-2S) protein [Gammaproteobacteria bacterium]
MSAPISTNSILCKLADLAATGSRGFRVGGGDWPLKGFVLRLDDGGLRAWINSCPHAGHPLDLLPHRFLTADRQFIQCSSHGALFDPASGSCVAGPCLGRKLRPVAVVLQGDDIVLASNPADVDNARPQRVAESPH